MGVLVVGNYLGLSLAVGILTFVLNSLHGVNYAKTNLETFSIEHFDKSQNVFKNNILSDRLCTKYVLNAFIDIQTSKELIQLDTDKMLTYGTFTMDDEKSHSHN